MILSSGFTFEQVSEQCSGQVINGFLQKPYRLECLDRVLREVLAESAGRE